jgi:DNA-binding CsgD family transcriptional regulator
LPQITQAWAEKTLMTSLRRQLVPDSEWYRSEHVDRFRRGAGVDDCIYSIAPNMGIPALGFHRAWGDKPYTERDRALIYALHAECLTLFGFEQPLDLSPRQHEVVRLLVQGLSEKEVADKMGITPSTAHGYIKILHKRLKVHSRAELLALVAGRNKPGAER